MFVKCNVYCEIYSYRIDIEKIKSNESKGESSSPAAQIAAMRQILLTYTKELFELGIPVLGLCYGAQLMMHVLGGKVTKPEVGEYGKTEVLIDKKDSKVFEGVESSTTCWMSHFDYIERVAPGFEIAAHTADCPVAAAENAEKKLYAIQFHPEVLHTVRGKEMLYNFVRGVCAVPVIGRWMLL